MLNKLNVLYTNSDILTNKLNELHLLAVEHHLDILMITEVKPTQFWTDYTTAYKIGIWHLFKLWG